MDNMKIGSAMLSHKQEYVFLYWVRMIAMFLVMWPHLSATLNPDWLILKWIRFGLNIPLGIRADFGALGTSFFFITTGFLLLHNDDVNRKKFFVGRFCRVFLTLWSSMACFAVIQFLFTIITGTQTWWTQFSTTDWIKSATLFDYIVGEQDLVNGVLWYLMPLSILYTLTLIFLPLAHKNPHMFIIVLQGVICVGMCIGRFMHIETGWITFTPFLELFVGGLLLYLVMTKKLHMMYFLIHLMTSYLIYIFGAYTFNSDLILNPPYLTSYCYAFFLFIFLYLTENKIADLHLTFPRKFSQISYSFYITHSLYGGMLISALTPCFGFTLAFCIAVPCCVEIAKLNYIFIERNTKNLFSF